MAVFQTLDPRELTFAFEEASVYRDMESGQDVFVDPTTAQRVYQQKLGAHLAAVEAACAGLGMMYQRVLTDEPLEASLFDFLQARMRRGRTARVASQGGSAGGVP